MSTAPAATPYVPLRERFNFRIIGFGLFVLMLLGYPMYVYVDSVVSGGIKDAGDGYKLVDLKAMSSFLFDQNAGTINDVPAKWRALDGQRVILEGEMWQPTSAGNSVDTFELVYSIAKCCFSGPPQIQHFIHSKVVDGKSVGYYPGLVRVRGTLHVDVKKDAGKIVSVYQFDVEDVEPAG
jgi:hypothetical protein